MNNAFENKHWLYKALVLSMMVLLCKGTTEGPSSNCTSPTDFLHGYLRELRNPKTIFYSCNYGFSLVGTHMQLCLEGKGWDPPDRPACVADYNCSKPERLPNGTISTDSMMPRMIFYYCNNGYHLDGPDKQECLQNGTWDPPQQPVCTADVDLKCSGRGLYGRHATVTANMPTNSSKQSVTVTCDKGYGVCDSFGCIEKLHLTCLDGVWTDINTYFQYLGYVACSVLHCPPGPDIAHARKESESASIGGEVTYTCYSGYHLENSANNKLVCRDGEWTGVRPSCVPLLEGDCSKPADIPNGRLTIYNTDDGAQSLSYYSKYWVGYRAEYSCDIGYRMIGASTLVCHSWGWDGTMPQCVEDVSVICPAVSNIENGICVCETRSDIKECGPFYYGDHVECTCDNGYELRGDSVLTCKSTGRWDYDLPSCYQGQSYHYLPAIFCYNESKLLWYIYSKSLSSSRLYNIHIPQRIMTAYRENELKIDTTDSRSTDDTMDTNHMSTRTLVIVVATACSVLGVLLLIMVIMVFRRHKPRPPSRLCRASTTPPPYSRVHNNSLDELDRYLMIGYENPNENAEVSLPSYEEAMSCSQSRIGNRQDHYISRLSGTDEGQGQVGEYRPLPSIPNSYRANQMMTGENTSRHSIITTSTMNRDGVSELFGSIDTVNVSVSDTSTAVTIETLDSATSHHSNMSRRATAGSIASENSNENLTTEDAPLLESHQRADSDKLDSDENGSDRNE